MSESNLLPQRLEEEDPIPRIVRWSRSEPSLSKTNSGTYKARPSKAYVLSCPSNLLGPNLQDSFQVVHNSLNLILYILLPIMCFYITALLLTYLMIPHFKEDMLHAFYQGSNRVLRIFKSRSPKARLGKLKVYRTGNLYKA